MTSLTALTDFDSGQLIASMEKMAVQIDFGLFLDAFLVPRAVRCLKIGTCVQ